MLVFKVFLFLYIGNLWKKTYPIVKEIQRFHSWSMIITIIQLFQSVGSIFLSSSTDLERKTKTEYLKKWQFYSHPKLSLYKENKNLDVAYKQQANITKTFSKIITERLWQESRTPEISLNELPPTNYLLEDFIWRITPWAQMFYWWVKEMKFMFYW